MPTTYAHYKFGQDVLNILPNDLQKIIKSNLDLFNIGVHGPDLLFYYKPIKSNNINKIGENIHSNSSYAFFSKSISTINNIQNSKDKNAAIAYICGFICHFVLDCEAHQYINKMVHDTSISHYEIEAEFDRILLLKDKFEPTSTKLTNHIKVNPYNAYIINLFFPKLTEKQLQKTLKSMIFYLNILVAPSKIKRNLIFTALKISKQYDSMHGLIINYDANKKCIEINNTLLKIYQNRLKTASLLIINYFSALSYINNLDKEFNRTFEK